MSMAYSHLRPHEGTIPMTSGVNLAVYARKLALMKRNDVDIRLDPQSDARLERLQTYTTGSAISGEVVISPRSSIQFQEIQITFEGQSHVSIDHMSQVAGHSTLDATQTFLRLTMPIPDSAYPEPRAVQAGSSLSIPFNFVIPSQLLPQACIHKCVADHVHDAHLQLPPSMGENAAGGKDHLTPDMARVHYYVSAKIMSSTTSSAKSAVLAQGMRIVHVIPHAPEAPPVHVDESSTEFQFIRAKKMKKGIFKGKLGDITFTAGQTKPFVIDPTSTDAPSMTANLTLRFSPADASSRPPRIGTIAAKIKANTFAAVKTQSDLARKIENLTAYDSTRGFYAATTPLTSLTLDSASSWKWIADDSPCYERRDSGYSSSSSDHDAFMTAPVVIGRGHYEAQLLVPLALPACKTWIPTFHSCLVSRTYGLDFSVSVHGPTSLATNLSLRLPVQLVSSSGAPLRDSEHLAIAAGVDEEFRPRVLSVPDAQFLQGSSLPGSRKPSDAEMADATDSEGEEGPAETDLPPGYSGGSAAFLRRQSEALALEQMEEARAAHTRTAASLRVLGC